MRSKGAIFPLDLLQRVAAGDRDLGGLDPESYHIGSGERLNEAITRSWNRLVGAWTAFRDTREGLPKGDPSTSITRERWLLPLFQELGYGRLQPARGVQVGGKAYPISHEYGNVPVHLVGSFVPLDQRTRGVAGAAGQSPHGLVQELVNRSPERQYGFVSNGLVLRFLRDNTSLTRQAYVEFDVESMFEGEVYADFVLLWLVCHQSRVEGERSEECWLERWTRAAAQQGTRALEGLRKGVEQAITAMGCGFLAHPGNAELREALRIGQLAKQDFYRQLLRLVYRLLFLFAAEDRGLLLDPKADPAARERYERYYSTSHLRRLAERRRGTRHGDLWYALRLVMQLLGEDSGCPELGLPALGSFLWSREALPLIEASEIANADLLEAVRALAFTQYESVRRVVDYKNLGTEELGSVYESLLELHPEVNVDAATFSLMTSAGHERRTTGSYYTPTSLVQELLNSALDPVLDEASKAVDAEAAILDLTVCDPACGSGHFLIAAAHRIAHRLAAVRTGDAEPSPEAVRVALRQVVGRCIYGVDVNEMAVELCKVSLWMEALDPGRPLSFLDHHIKCGNSLIGATPFLVAQGIRDEVFKPIEGDDSDFATARRRDNRRERDIGTTRFVARLVAEPGAKYGALPGRFADLDAIPDDSINGIHEKERRYQLLATSSEYLGARIVADAWSAAFFWWKHQHAPPPMTHDLFLRLQANPGAVPSAVRTEIARLAEQYRSFQWHLAFPKVFRVPAIGEPENPQTGWSGGFDVVLGNPPWERVKLQEKEFFEGVGRADIASARNRAERQRLVARLMDEDESMWMRFREALRKAEAESHFLRDSGRYPLAGRGDVNTYAVFAECMRSLVSSRGRVGCILPIGIATDDTTKHFFNDLVQRGSLVRLSGFENEKFIFPNIHHATKFCLLTLTGSARRSEEAEFIFFARSAADLGDTERRFALTAEDFALLNPNTRTCPIFRTRRDAEITKGIYRRVPVLVNEKTGMVGNPWGVKFLAMFHMANDSHLFRTRERLETEGFRIEGNVFRKGDEVWLPLYEAKMVHHFDHRFGMYEGQTAAQANQGKLPELTDEQHSDPNFLALPRYWVLAQEVDARLSEKWGRTWLLGWRDISSAVVARTVIAAVIPRAGAGHTFLLAFSAAAHPVLACLVASLDSVAQDYAARQKVGGTHLTYHVFKQLPVLPPSVYENVAPWSYSERLRDWIRPRVLELSYTAWDLQGFARDLGYSGAPFRWNAERRFLLRAELDAAFFHLYGISREEGEYILDAFRIIKEREEKRFGGYRTKHVIFEIYEAMARAIETGEPYRTILDPPPADPRVAHEPEGRVVAVQELGDG